MDIFTTRFSNQDLNKLSPTERTLVFQLGHVCNELAFLHKLLPIVSDTERRGVQRTGSTAQAMIVARIFVGKVFEAWLMLTKEYFGSELREEFDSLLPEKAEESLDRLKKAFGSSNLMSVIRNKFSFHYLSEHIDEIINIIDDDYDFRLISGGRYDNTLYAFAEDVVSYAMLNKTDESEPQEAMDKLIGTLIDVSGDLLNYTSELLGALMHARLPIPSKQSEWEKEVVDVEVDLEKFKMPFFFTHSKDG